MQLLREIGGAFARFCVAKKNREFIAADARRQIARVERFRDSLAGRDEQLVADHVAEAVVDDFEEIEIEEQHRQRVAVFLRARDFFFEALSEESSIRKLRQRIVHRLIGESPLGFRAIEIQTKQQPPAPSDQQQEKRHEPNHQQPHLEFRIDEPRAVSLMTNPAERRRNDEHRRQQTSQHHPAAGFAEKDRHQAVRRPREQDADRHDKKSSRGVQRHRDVGADDVERLHAVQVTHQCQKRRHGGGDGQVLRRPPSAEPPIDVHHRQTEQKEIEGGVRRHLIRQAEVAAAELAGEQKLVDVQIDRRDQRQNFDQADRGRDQRESFADPMARFADFFARKKRQRNAEEDEADRGHRIHRHQPRHDALQNVDVG